MAELAKQFVTAGIDARYAGYFALFNQQKFYEAHDMLEDLWLPDRHGPNGNFYKGLIQLAGAFVHLQKGRFGPAAALFRLSRTNLEPYPPVHEKLDRVHVLKLVDERLHWLERGEGKGEIDDNWLYPKIRLETGPLACQ
jgi:predicted metal-dependent hydrolase